jgi:hypothetical protein
MTKAVWITSLNQETGKPATGELQQTVVKYGLDALGHYWVDDLEKAVWAAVLDELKKPEVAVWVILGTQEDFERDSFRFGLSLIAIGLQAQKGHGFPILLMVTQGELSPESLPTPLKGADILGAGTPATGAKLVAKANTPVPQVASDYRLNIYGLPGLGTWFEVGPSQGHTWAGAMLGVMDGKIHAHGVGPREVLPQKAVLEYPSQGLKLELGGDQYIAWALKNQLTESDSYFVGVKECPKSLVFGPHPEADDAEVYSVRLK